MHNLDAFLDAFMAEDEASTLIGAALWSSREISDGDMRVRTCERLQKHRIDPTKPLPPPTRFVRPLGKRARTSLTPTNDPGAHDVVLGVQAAAPGEALNPDSGQMVQAVTPDTLENVPVGQGSQPLAPVRFMYCPGEQGAHCTCPVSELDVPGGHGTQLTPSAL